MVIDENFLLIFEFYFGLHYFDQSNNCFFFNNNCENIDCIYLTFIFSGKK